MLSILNKVDTKTRSQFLNFSYVLNQSQYINKRIDHQLNQIMVKVYQPFKIAKDTEFQTFVKLLYPGF